MIKVITSLAMHGKYLIILDPEHEYEELIRNLGGTYLDLMKGDYKINVLECRTWDVDDEEEEDAPAAFKQKTAVSQHMSFLLTLQTCRRFDEDVRLIILCKEYERKEY